MKVFASRLFPVALSLLTVSLVHGDWKSDIGWPEFVAEAGLGYPDGSGVLVVQVEADYSTAPGLQYVPNAADPQMSGKTISDATGGGDVSSHALTVAKLFYGNSSSVAPGVNNILVYEANDYLSSLSGISSSRRVHSNAWVGGASTSTLGSIDQKINSKGFLLVAGLANQNTSVPDIFGTTYNALSVGLSDGGHSSGGTVKAGYGPGRVKPEVVIPHGTIPGNSWTSFATGEVSSVAAVLYDEAASGGHSDAEANSEVMKAILMAGAVKYKFPGWDRTTTRPLDEVYGAGEVNIFHSYRILDAGEQSSGGSVESMGWSRSSLRNNSTTERSYSFTLADTAAEFSAVLNWNYSGSGTLRNLGLCLERTDGGTVLYDESQSEVDNVEHIYYRNLPAGSYTLKATLEDFSQGTVYFGLAWRTELGGGAVSEIALDGGLPEIMVSNVFKGKEHKIRRSVDLISWADVHTFTPTSWDDYSWTDLTVDPGMDSPRFYRTEWGDP